MKADNLDQACPACGRPTGDHMLREWVACLGGTTLDLPYEDEPTVKWIQGRVRGQFGIGDDTIVADHVVCRALVADGYSGIVRIKTPGVSLEFQIGLAGKAPEPVARVLFMGDEATMIAFGDLVQQSAEGAVRAVGRL